MSVLEISEAKVCRVHRYAEHIFPFTNDKLESLVVSKFSARVVKTAPDQLHKMLKRKAPAYKLPVCKDCVAKMKKISLIRKSKYTKNYPCLLDLAIWEELPTSKTFYGEKGAKIASQNTKLQWRDFLAFIKAKYYSETKIQEVSEILREMLGVTQEMIRADMAWFSEDDYTKQCEKTI